MKELTFETNHSFIRHERTSSHLEYIDQRVAGVLLKNELLLIGVQQKVHQLLDEIKANEDIGVEELRRRIILEQAVEDTKDQLPQVQTAHFLQRLPQSPLDEHMRQQVRIHQVHSRLHGYCQALVLWFPVARESTAELDALLHVPVG